MNILLLVLFVLIMSWAVLKVMDIDKKLRHRDGESYLPLVDKLEPGVLVYEETHTFREFDRSPKRFDIDWDEELKELMEGE